ncbi:hypothetical protein AMTR_s00030p00178130 [Amborella trichopoda]|uniref:Aluminum-activated malate transporter n=2 Tax=Amborella trichopoda TaxID=13333 RepID=U5CS97_AMBTC|nr:hypothetical protein AMTR_s00030p00178130 [Amborella trichopoda]
MEVNGGSSKEMPGFLTRVWQGIISIFAMVKSCFRGFFERVWKLGKDDPRRVVHSLKVGLALTLVSLFYFMRPLYDGVGGMAIWAVMTVVVVFEYSVGATLSKGLNRGFATLLAGSLAVGVHELASLSGDKSEPIILGISVFLQATVFTFLRFFPTIKTRYDYGAMIFILTFSLVSVSGYRVDKLLEMAHQRLSTILIGSALCVLVSMLVCPVWAGEDLHNLIAKNLDKLAASVEGVVAENFKEGEGEEEGEINEENPSVLGYKCVLNSKPTEEALANFARWEPAHGPFGFRHPWKQYLKIGMAARYCAYSLEALNACTNSDSQAAQELTQHLKAVCTKVGHVSSDLLLDLSSTVKKMTTSSHTDLLVAQLNIAVQELQLALKILSNPLPVHVSIPDIVLIATVASLTVEISARVEDVAEAVEELSRIAHFKTETAEENKQKAATIKALADSDGPHVAIHVDSL